MNSIIGLFDPIYKQTDALAEKLKVEPKDALYIAILSITLTLAPTVRIIPKKNPRIRYGYILAVGLFIVLLQFREGSVHALVATLYCYILLHAVPPRICPYVTFFISFLHVMIMNVGCYVANYGPTSQTPAYVIFFHIVQFKLTSVPFNVLDGIRLKNGEDESMIPEQKENAMMSKPTFLQYFSYQFAFMNLSTTPVVEIRKYIGAMEDEEHEAPFDLYNILHRAFCGFFFMFVFSQMKKLGIDISTIEYEGKTLLFCWMNCYLVWTVTRIRIYSGFHLGECATIASGIGYSGKDEYGNHTWDHAKTSDVIKCETSMSIRTSINNWNISVAKWLRFYIYERLPKSFGFFRLLAPMVFSALSHGIYPGMLLLWVSLSLMNDVYRELFRKFVPKKYKGKAASIPLVYQLFMWLILQVYMGYFTASFILVKDNEFVNFYNKFSWAGQVYLIALFVLVKIIKFLPIGNDGKAKNKGKKL